MPVFAETTCRSPSVSLFVTLLLRYEMIASPINHLFCFSVSAAQRPALAASGWDAGRAWKQDSAEALKTA